ncbi:hypothetical protein Chor_001093 [Crotalus horridus]
MTQGSVLLFILYLSHHVFAQGQNSYLIEECLENNYTEQSCEKVFCQPWQTCIEGTCHCKIPYQCPRNGTSVCSTVRRSFQTYCQLKSYECRQRSSKFLSRGLCNREARFNVLFSHKNASSEGIIQIELSNSEKSFLCEKGLTIHEANVICRHLGFAEGADGKESVEPDEDQNSHECLKATCRGTETSLAECDLKKIRLTTGKLAKVICHTEQRGDSNQVIESMDEERKRTKTLLPVISCGITNHTVTRQKRIIGGFTAKPHDFPWQVAIRGEGQTMNCGGVYIGGCWILTAAHCVRRSRLHVYKIWTGLVDSIKFNTRVETFSLKDMIIHEHYNSKTYQNDIALLEMKTKNEGTPCSPPDTVPVCIPWSQYMFGDGHRCKVSGWGLDEESTRQYILKWGYVTLMGNCSEIYKNRYFKGMECAGTDDGSVDACKGDSGGPLVCFDHNNVGYLWGVVSWGENCGEKGHPGVYTKVALYFDWIAQHTGIALISKYNL